jgi:uncharacterized protein YceK
MRAVVTVLCVAFLSGCLSILRVPFPAHSKYSDEGVCTNRVWSSPLDAMPALRVYPTIKLRCKATAGWWAPIRPDLKGRDLWEARQFKRWAWIPLCVLWLTSPVDAVVDTLFLPCDMLSGESSQ